MKEISGMIYDEERALYSSSDLTIKDTVFKGGESALKECHKIDVTDSFFKWKYPIWYSNNINVKNCTFFDDTRAGLWYVNDLCMSDCVIKSPKNLRRCNNVTLNSLTFTNAPETLWECSNVNIKNMTVKGDYFGMNCHNMTIDGLTLDGNYTFDGVKNVTIENSTIIGRDAFWNSENVTVKNCLLTGAYLGWNTKNITFIGCTIESLQGLCYIDNLVMKDCKLINTNLAFEYSSIDADVKGDIISVLNPKSGTLKAEHIEELILEKERINPCDTNIICDRIDKISEKAVYTE